MTLGPLFEPPAQRHSETSIAAASAIKPKVATLRALVLEFIAFTGRVGTTDEEMIDALGLNPSTARPRRVELWDAGLIVPAAFTRKTRSNREATVWLAVHA